MPIIKNKARIYWACRRGMRELDLILKGFFEQQYDRLSHDDKQQFIELLQQDDIVLYDRLINKIWQSNDELTPICHLINRSWRDKNGAVARKS